MGKQNATLLSFNRGEVSRYAMARVDVERMRLSAEEQINWAPWVLGPMMLRPGLKYCGATRSNLACRLIPFIFGSTDVALLEFTASYLRIWTVSDAADTETLVTRPTVSTTVTNGDFSSSTGWTLTATGSGASAAISGGKLTLASPASGGIAQAKRSVTVSAGDQNVVHGFRIVVDHGPIIFRAGSTDGDDDYISETTLDTGVHSLAFTPTGGTVYIQLEVNAAQTKTVDSITIDSAGVLTIPTSFVTADLPNIRYAQSGDIVYLTCQGQQQHKIERRGVNSWSSVLYKSDDGPFQASNSTTITMTPNDYYGTTTLTASRAYFNSSHVGTLFRLFTKGQHNKAVLGAADSFSTPVRVSGVGTLARDYSWTVSGTWVGTLTLQRSFDGADSGFSDVSTVTSNGTMSSATGSAVNGSGHVDPTNDPSPLLDNIIAWERVGFKAGNYTSGSATVISGFTGGGAAGICRVMGYTSSTLVSIEVLTPFSSLDATTDWNEGDWSDIVGWPSALRFHDGRLWFAGRDRIWGSVSDDYTSFDIDKEGDAGPINRSVGFGAIDNINWLLDLSRLIVGRQGAETSVRSGSFDEPLTPTNFTLKDCSTQGSYPIAAVKIDTRGVFVQQSNRRVYELGFSAEGQDYTAHNLTRLNPDIGSEGFVDLDVQRQPDTQIHLVRGDGQVAALLHDVDDAVEAWWRIDTDGGVGGEVESVAVLPGADESRVYYVVKRTIGGSTVRYLEKMAKRSQSYGLPSCHCADSHIIYSGSAVTTITGLSHLEGETVVVWGWNTVTPFTSTLPDGTVQTVGKDFGTFTVTSGQVTGLSSAVTDACVGLTYSATFKSAKLAYAAQMGTALTQTKKIDKVGLILANTHYQGIEYGEDFTTMDNLPLVEDGDTTDTSAVWSDFDKMMVTVPGTWNTDSRLCLRATAPRPCMVLAAVVGMTTNED